MEQHIALVTGGTGGIGTAISQRLAEDGFRVIATCSSPARRAHAEAWRAEQRERGFDIAIELMDVSSFESCAAAAADIREKYGVVDVLVNNAGITRDAVMKKMQMEQWKDVIDTNLGSVFNVTKQFLDDMLERQYGRIVNISSINGQKGQFGQVNYSAAKAGIHGFTKALAQEVARKGVTVNTISPGYVATAMVMAVAEEVREKIKAQIPVGRFAEPEEIARAVSFLTAKEAGYITGSNLSINGGQHMY
ncbi:acetoacetyl-CoA reductase [Hahella sp. HN01]|uniref:acetoacetyl-CoA reductase n=1 Tax=Hahella sp. HN01 TaxID=2847262 RepID=UPI001C1EFD99|nr:acetoacetyl-CoA reductase [Hahella sp. HN01]MBU6952435.1 acetoacetyl-CoA reductase [Hahella sp. HN01]